MATETKGGVVGWVVVGCVAVDWVVVGTPGVVCDFDDPVDANSDVVDGPVDAGARWACAFVMGAKGEAVFSGADRGALLVVTSS